jgi:hypothetical protein
MKETRIEWRHLESEGATCERCGDTGAALGEVLRGLREELREEGVEIRFTETKLGPDRISESNLILVDGVPLENWLSGASASENTCGSCSEILGVETCCRTVEIEGVTHEAVPAALIRQAVRKAAEIPS